MTQMEGKESVCSHRASREEIRACEFASWYPQFQKLTIKSIVIPLSKEFVEYLGEDGVVLPEGLQQPYSKSNLSDDDSLATVEDENDGESKPNFDDLIESMREALKTSKGKVFPKLNWSAPIDAAWVNRGTMKCSNPFEIITLLKSSNRITFDLENMFDLCQPVHGEPTCDSDFTLILREWREINPASEFRLFVYESNLIAICQRECSSYFEFMKEKKYEYRATICSFFDEKIAQRFPLKSYTVDVYIDSAERVRIVDFNPFGEPTSALMLEWSHFDDLLTSGRDGAELSGPHPEIPPTAPTSENTDPDDVSILVIESENERMTSTKGAARGPIDVSEAPDFSKFMELCRQQARLDDASSDMSLSDDES